MFARRFGSMLCHFRKYYQNVLKFIYIIQEKVRMYSILKYAYRTNGSCKGSRESHMRTPQVIEYLGVYSQSTKVSERIFTKF